MRIGEVAAKSGLRTSAIRYYEKMGVLPRASRRNGIRQYGPEVLDQLVLVSLAQQAGFQLDEIKTLLRALTDKRGSVAKLQRMATKKLPELRRAVARAEAMVELMSYAEQCRCPSLDACAGAARERGLIA